MVVTFLLRLCSVSWFWFTGRETHRISPPPGYGRGQCCICVTVLIVEFLMGILLLVIHTFCM